MTTTSRRHARLLEQTASGLSIYGRLRRLGNAPQIAGERTTVDFGAANQDRRKIASIANVCGPNLFDALCKCHKQTRRVRLGLKGAPGVETRKTRELKLASVRH